MAIPQELHGKGGVLGGRIDRLSLLKRNIVLDPWAGVGEDGV